MKNLIFRRGFADLRGGAWQERGERGVSNDFRGELQLL